MLNAIKTGVTYGLIGTVAYTVTCVGSVAIIMAIVSLVDKYESKFPEVNVQTAPIGPQNAPVGPQNLNRMHVSF